MTYAALLTQTCTIRRATAGAADQWNQPGRAWADLATGVACRLSAAKGREVADADKQVTVRLDRLYLPAGQGIAERDRVVIGGQTYGVLFVGQAEGRGGQSILFADIQRVV